MTRLASAIVSGFWRRCWTRDRAACWSLQESKVWGPGGISVVSRATGISRQVIRLWLKELSQPPAQEMPGRS